MVVWCNLTLILMRFHGDLMVTSWWFIYENWWAVLRFHGILWVNIGYHKNCMMNTENRLQRSSTLADAHVETWRQFLKKRKRWSWWPWFSQLVTRLAHHGEKWSTDIVFVLVAGLNGDSIIEDGFGFCRGPHISQFLVIEASGGQP